MNTEALLDRCNQLCKGNLLEHFQISFTEIAPDKLIAKMPITQVVCQPDGVLHGGASAALAESVGSVASIVLVAKENEIVRGIDIQMNHIRAAVLGETIFATATCIHAGRTLQHWDIKITNAQNKIIAYGKHSTIILPKKE